MFDFGVGFAKAHHEAGFGHDVRAVRPGKAEDVEGLEVVGLRAYAAVEARGGFHVVVENVGSGVEDAGHGVGVAFEIRGEDFDAGVGQRGADQADGFGEVGGAAVGEVVTVDAGDDDVAEVHFSGHAGDVGRFGGVEAHVVQARVPLGTEQKPQPRVQRLPRIMNVAAPRWKHSWMLGQRADSQTVWRLSARRPDLSLLSDSKWV